MMKTLFKKSIIIEEDEQGNFRYKSVGFNDWEIIGIFDYLKNDIQVQKMRVQKEYIKDETKKV